MGSPKVNLTNNKLNLSHSLFDNDAMFFETNQDVIKLKSSKNSAYLEISYCDMTCVGLWHKPKTSAPYVCIEPWHGVPSVDGKIDDLETKLQTIKLGENQSYKNSYSIKVVE